MAAMRQPCFCAIHPAKIALEMEKKMKKYRSGSWWREKWEITWKNVTTTTFDRKRLAKEHKELYEEYCTRSRYRRFNVA